jgi:hypothetical protein
MWCKISLNRCYLRNIWNMFHERTNGHREEHGQSNIQTFAHFIMKHSNTWGSYYWREFRGLLLTLIQHYQSRIIGCGILRVHTLTSVRSFFLEVDFNSSRFHKTPRLIVMLTKVVTNPVLSTLNPVRSWISQVYQTHFNTVLHLGIAQGLFYWNFQPPPPTGLPCFA